MTQRNNTPDLPQHSKAFAAAAGHHGFVNAGDSTSTRVAAPASRTRRGARIAASLPIEVRDQFGGREETRTQFLMVRGAVLATTSNVRVGHKLTIQNIKSGRIAECHVISVEPVVRDVHQIEVEFTRPQPEFWPVQFPAEDLKANDAPGLSTASLRASSEPDPRLVVDQANGSTLNLETGFAHEPVVHNDQLVVLADTVQTFAPVAQERYSPRTATLDSVAQFRAANRAAHRRERQMKALFSFLSIVALAGAFFGYRWWDQHQPQRAQAAAAVQTTTPTAEPVAATQESHSASTTAPTVAAPTQVSSSTETASVKQVPVAVTTMPEVAPAPVQKAEEAQVQVRHGSMSASLHKAPQAEEEAPLAMPLRAGDEAAQVKPEMLSSVVSQVPAKNAVLAPQPVKKAVEAKLLRTVPAQYPQMARQLRVEGEVLLKIDIDTSGNIAAAHALSGPPMLRQAAIDAVQRWKYQPATLGDKPVESTQAVKVDFHLH